MNNISFKKFSKQKSGNMPEYNEDSLDIDNTATDFATFCVCDGSTESFFSSVWSKELSKGFKEYISHKRKKSSGDISNEDGNGNVDILGWEVWLQARADSWREQLSMRELSNIAKIIISRGKDIAYSTLHAISIEVTKDLDVYSFSSYCIGDSCLFQMRCNHNDIGGYDLIKRIPEMTHKDFNCYPELIGTRGGWPKLIHNTGSLLSDDILLLMTDALAEWFLCQFEKHREEKAWLKVLKINNIEELRQLFTEELEKGCLKNDDLTIVIISFVNKPNGESDLPSEILTKQENIPDDFIKDKSQFIDQSDTTDIEAVSESQTIQVECDLKDNRSIESSVSTESLCVPQEVSGNSFNYESEYRDDQFQKEIREPSEPYNHQPDSISG